ncbi:MAG TPA: hypothetical protein VF580_03295 [Thermoanaerobaculia bacterium]
MLLTVRRSALAAFGVALALVLTVPASARRPVPRKSPHGEIVAVSRVETAPAQKTHKNRRKFLEFDVRILSFTRAPEGDEGGDPNLLIETKGKVHVVHDLTCGGSLVDLRVGDQVEIKGEYVKPDNGKDLIHFTHPADGSCGVAGGHPGGYIRKTMVRLGPQRWRGGLG